MSSDSFKVKNSLNIDPKASPTLDQNGDLAVDSSTNKLKVRLNGTTENVASEAYADTVASTAASALSSHESDTTSIHGIADTSLLVTTTGTQALTNKDIDGGTASNTSRITLPKAAKATLDALTRKEATVVYASDTDKLYYDDGSILKLVGSGSGGAVNFITDGDAEGANIWTAYADAAATRPVDGTGGSPNVTATISATTPLAGTNSFVFTKDAANRQGEGIATTFSVDLAYRAKVCQIEFDYIVGSGTFVAGSTSADSDIIAYIYDVTNSTLIEPSSIKLLSNSSTISDKFVANFQTSATGASYRLILHCATTSASAYTLKLDSVRVGPSAYVYGTPITDWVSYTPTGSWTNTTYAGRWRRVGDSMQVNAQLTLLSAPGAATLTVNLPSGYTIDTAKIPNSTIYDAALGVAHFRDFSGSFYTASARYNNATSLLFTVDAGGIVTETVPFTWASADQISVQLQIPITGWSSSTQVSDSYSGREIDFLGLVNSGTHTSTGSWQAAPNFTSLVIDTVASSTTSTNAVTIVSSGKYKISGKAAFVTNSTGSRGARITKNGTAINGSSVITPSSSGSFTTAALTNIEADLVAGDLIRLEGFQNSGGNLNWSTSADEQSALIVTKLSSSATISATEVVSFSADTSTTAATSSTPFIYTNVLNNSHGAYSSANGKFTAPTAGFYFFKATAYNAASFTMIITKNGTSVTQGAVAGTSGNSAEVTWAGQLNAGDIVDARPNTSVTAGGQPLLHFFTGFRIK